MINLAPILVKFLITIVLINGEPHLKLKIINKEKSEIYVVDNFDYHSICWFMSKPGWGMNLVVQSPDPYKRIEIRRVSRPKKNTAILLSLDTNTLDNRKYHSKKLSRSIFWSYPATINYITRKINKQSKILKINSSDSLVHFIKLQDNLFLKSSYCKAESREECLPIKVDSLEMFAKLMFRYSFKQEEKPKNFSYFFLDSDTVRFKVE